MNILFVNTHFHLPQSVGGIANTLHQLCLGLIGRGHDVSVLAAMKPARTFFARRAGVDRKLRALTGGPRASCDRGLGYDVWRAWDPIEALPGLVASRRPDVIVVMGGKVVPVTQAAEKLGIPAVIQLHDMEVEWLGGDLGAIRDFPFITNSQTTRSFYLDKFGVDSTVIYPMIPKEDYRVESDRSKVTFIHPIERKGLRQALAMVELCPDIPFSFIGHVAEQYKDGTSTGADKLSFPNLTVGPFVSDMREVYRHCRILLAPSQWQEAFGRVISEAQISGIPALASDRGGIPEAMGEGGVLLPADAPAEDWAEALRRMWFDADYYEELASKAVASANRTDLDEASQLARHEQILREAVAAR